MTSSLALHTLNELSLNVRAWQLKWNYFNFLVLRCLFRFTSVCLGVSSCRWSLFNYYCTATSKDGDCEGDIMSFISFLHSSSRPKSKFPYCRMTWNMILWEVNLLCDGSRLNRSACLGLFSLFLASPFFFFTLLKVFILHLILHYFWHSVPVPYLFWSSLRSLSVFMSILSFSVKHFKLHFLYEKCSINKVYHSPFLQTTDMLV